MKRMLISFFEEFPTKENLDKLKLIARPSKLYLAAESLKEFEKIKKRIGSGSNNKKVKEFIYWPILKKKEGYWLSPFSERKALLRIFNELKGSRTAVMLDLELPTTQNPLLYITQPLSFFGNKSLIRHFIANYLGKVYLAEYYPVARSREKLLEFLGLHYEDKSNKVKIIKMLYHSMLPFGDTFFRKEMALGKKRYENNYIVGFGTLSTGVLGCEPTLSPEQLEKDLLNAQKEGVEEVVIYRLGGLNKEYAKIIEQM